MEDLEEPVEPVVLNLQVNPFIAYECEQERGVHGFQCLWRADLQFSPVKRVNYCNELIAILKALIMDAMDDIAENGVR